MDIKSYVECELKLAYEKLSDFFDIPVEKAIEWIETPEELPIFYWNKILEKSYHTMDFIEAYEKPFSSSLKFDYEYPTKEYKQLISKIFEEFNSTYFDNRITNYQKTVSMLYTKMAELFKKPKIAFLGKSDAGKSSIINSFLGAEKMPISWTPLTSIVVYIKHIEDKPCYMEKTTFIFKKGEKGELWDESKLKDKEYCEKWIIESGDIELLQKYGTNRENSNAGTAVVFLDFPMLKNCDIVDVPGITSGSDGDNAKATAIINLIDIVVYLSQANGFLSEADIKYINNIFENFKNRKEIISTVDSMFFVASQADTLNENFDESVNAILNKGSERLYKNLRSAKIAENLTLERLRSRFFAYSICIRFNERTKLEKAVENYFSHYYQILKCWIDRNSNYILDEFSNDYNIISSFKHSVDNTKKFRHSLKKYKKTTLKVSKKILKVLKKNTTKLLKNKKIDVYKGYNLLSIFRTAKLDANNEVKEMFSTSLKELIALISEKYPCDLFERAFERQKELFVIVSNEISKLYASKSAYKLPLLRKKVKRKAFIKKEIKDKIEPVVDSTWNALSEYVLCLYIFSQYQGYDFKKFHCYSMNEIYDSYDKNIQSKTMMEKIVGISSLLSRE